MDRGPGGCEVDLPKGFSKFSRDLLSLPRLLSVIETDIRRPRVKPLGKLPSDFFTFFLTFDFFSDFFTFFLTFDFFSDFFSDFSSDFSKDAYVTFFSDLPLEEAHQ